jgi:hypothetical protein
MSLKAIAAYAAVTTVLGLMSIFPVPAHAADTRFMCHTESAVNALAAQIIKGDDNADDAMARPYIQSGECLLLPVSIDVQITYRGKVFEKEDGFKIQVVGFPILGTENKLFYGIMPVEPADENHPSQPAHKDDAALKPEGIMRRNA